MNILNKIKKIIFIILIIVLALFLKCCIVQAIPSLSTGDTISVGFADTSHNKYKLLNTSWLYCIDHGASLSSERKNLYTVKYTVNIVGNQATLGNNSVTSKYNAGLAYILAKGGGYGSSESKTTSAQKALWAYWNTWLSNVGKNLGINYSKYKNNGSGSKNTVYKNAVNYANNFSGASSSAASISGSSSIKFRNGYATYKAKFTGKVKSIVVTYNDDSTETITSTSNNVKFYSDSNLTKEISVTNISSGTTFYIKNNNSNKVIKNFKINVSKSASGIYTATIYILKSNTGSQRLLAAKAGKTSKTYKASITVNVTEVGNLKITKQGSGSEKLSGVEFKLYNETLGQWVLSSDGTGTGNISYLSDTQANFEKATAFKTESNGLIKVEGLKTGSYRIVEISIGDNSAYSTKINGTTMGTIEDKTYYGTNYSTVKGVPVAAGSSVGLTITDERETGDISIIKVDSEDTSKTLQGIEFKIYVENDIKGESYWLVANGENGVYDYTGIEYEDIISNYTASSQDADNTTFVTNSEGKIAISGSPLGKYYFYEASTYGIEYAIDEQKGYDSTTGLALIDTVELTADNPVIVNYQLQNIPRKKGNLTISKKGTYGNNGQTVIESLPNMSFKLYSSVEGDNKEGNWVILGENKDGKQIIDFTSNFEDATVFTTDENGELTIEGLYIDFNPYIIVEILNDEIDQNQYYTDPIVIEGGSQVKIEDETYYAVSVDIKEDTTLQYEIIDDRTSGDLTIEKYDYTYNDLKLEGAEFKLQLIEAEYQKDSNGIWLVQNQDGTFDYTNKSADSATSFVTDKEGKITLKCLRNGTYAVYETKAPEGYDITKQDGYDNQTGWVHVGDVTVSTKDNIVTYKIANRKIVDELDGYVWVDEPDTKANVRDNIYGSESNDWLKEGITVNLYDGTNTLIATTITDSEGYYKFTTKNASSYTGEDKNIYYWDLANAYVEFIYNNKTIYNQDGTVSEYGYVVVDPFVGNNVSVNSKAQEYTVTTDKLDDNNLTGTTGENPGRAVTYQSTKNMSANELIENTNNISEKIENSTVSYDDLKETPLTGYYDNETYKVSNINLGLAEQHDPQFTVDETLAYIKVKMKGYTYTYKYGEPEATESINVPTVNQQNSKKTFSGKIYPSDIAYNMAENKNELQVYAVYAIDVKNSEPTYFDDIYVEEKLYLDSLVNTYDTNRYELCTSENNNDSSDFVLWQDLGNGQASYDVNNDNSVYKNGMGKQETKTSYIQFKIKEKALEDILTNNLTEEVLEKVPTIATARGYHEYLRTDNAWVHDSNIRAFNGAKGTNEYDERNASGDKYYVHKSISKSYLSSSLYLKLKLGEARTISGTVFEDIRTEESGSEGTNIGNGIIDTDENNRAKDVTVELLNEDKTTVTKLYQENNGDIVYNEDGTLPDAIAETEEGGTFTFTGVVPGYYYIRFTYGERNDEGEFKQIMLPVNEVIKSNDYRSTIINTADNDSVIKNAMEATADELENAQQTLVNDYSNENAKKLVEWYKYLGDTPYSTAVDDIEQRLKIEDYVYKEDGKVYDESGNVVTDYPTNINSYTPMVGISIENDINDYTDNGDSHSPIYNEFNFGIIKQSDTEISLDKKITNVDLTTQTGSTLVSANPTDRTASYVTALDNITGGSKYSKVEIDPSLIYGSTLKTTYELTISNNSIKDYIEEENSGEFGYYYKYGVVTNSAQLKKITINEVIDDLDDKYDYDWTNKEIVETVVREDGKVEESTVTIEKPEEVVTTETSETETVTNPEGGTTTTTSNSMSIKGWSELASSEHSSIDYTVTSLLSIEDDDTLYTNAARITSISLDKLSTLNSNFEWGDKLKDTTTLTITPTTGADRSNIYWIAGAVSLVVIALGFVLLKKKVLK